MHRARPRLIELVAVAHALRQPTPLAARVALRPELLTLHLPLTLRFGRIGVGPIAGGVASERVTSSHLDARCLKRGPCLGVRYRRVDRRVEVAYDLVLQLRLKALVTRKVGRAMDADVACNTEVNRLHHDREKRDVCVPAWGG